MYLKKVVNISKAVKSEPTEFMLLSESLIAQETKQLNQKSKTVNETFNCPLCGKTYKINKNGKPSKLFRKHSCKI